jgi:hypothetical protein
MKRTLPDGRRRVRALPRADRAVDAVNYLSAACANSTIRGVILVTIDHAGGCEMTVCGRVLRNEMCWAGSEMQHEALRKD